MLWRGVNSRESSISEWASKSVWWWTKRRNGGQNYPGSRLSERLLVTGQWGQMGSADFTFQGEERITKWVNQLDLRTSRLQAHGTHDQQIVANNAINIGWEGRAIPPECYGDYHRISDTGKQCTIPHSEVYNFCTFPVCFCMFQCLPLMVRSNLHWVLVCSKHSWWRIEHMGRKAKSRNLSLNLPSTAQHLMKCHKYLKANYITGWV